MMTPKLLLHVVLLSTVVLSSVTADDMKTVHDRVLAALKPSDPAKAIQDAKDVAATLLPNGTWPDINYHDDNRVVWSPATHVARCQTMAVGIHVQANATLTSSLNLALSTWIKMNPMCPNWWFNQISVPQTLSYTVLLTTMPKDLVDGLNTIMERANWGKWTGANRIWMLGVQMRRGLWLGNETLVAQAFSVNWETMVPNPGLSDGIQADSSFHQHSDPDAGMLLAGSYGAIYPQLLMEDIGYAANTSFAPSPTQLDVFGGLVADGQALMSTADTWDVNVVGRGMSRPGGPGDTSFNAPALRTLASVSPKHATGLTQFADRIDGSAPPTVPTGNKYFWDSDYGVSRTESWAMSVRMHSVRSVAWRCVNEEAKIGQHRADGLVALYKSGSEYEDMGALWDYNGLPGVTGVQGAPFLPCSYGPHVPTTEFVNGVSDENGMTAGMNLTSNNGLLAYRSWSTFPTANHGGFYVALGSIVKPASLPNPVTTTLDSRVANGTVTVMEQGGSAPSTVSDGAFHGNYEWLAHSGSVYGPLDSTASLPVSGYVGDATGVWSHVGVYPGNVTQSVFNASIGHGAGSDVAGKEFGYIVLPAVGVDDAAAAVADIQKDLVVVQSQSAHAVGSVSTGSARMVFWKDNGSVTLAGIVTVSVTNRCFVSVSITSSSVTVTASNPDKTVVSTDITVELLGKAAVTGNCSGVRHITFPTSKVNMVGSPVTTVCSL